MRVRGSYTVAVSALLCLLAIAFVDRPIVLALDAGYRKSVAWVVVDRAFLGVEPIFLLIAIAGAWLMFTVRGRRQTSWWADDLRSCTVIGVVALVVAVVLKVVFGRSGPDFTFVRDGIYEFRWFSGMWTPYHGAFPSGTAAVTSAMATMLWIRRSPVRLPGVAIAALLSIAVVVQQYHWLSDAIAGSALGILTASAVHVRLVTQGLAGHATESYTPL